MNKIITWNFAVKKMGTRMHICKIKFSLRFKQISHRIVCYTGCIILRVKKLVSGGHLRNAATVPSDVFLFIYFFF